MEVRNERSPSVALDLGNRQHTHRVGGKTRNTESAAQLDGELRARREGRFESCVLQETYREPATKVSVRFVAGGTSALDTKRSDWKRLGVM